MGREAHQLRLALGRSADEPPDWDAVTDRYAFDGEYYVAIDRNLPDYGQVYDVKGRPVNKLSRNRNKEIADACNAVLAVAKVCEKDSRDVVDEEEAFSSMAQSTTQDRPQYWKDMGIVIVSRLFHDLSTYWIGTIEGQLQVFPSHSQISISQYFAVQYRHYGLYSILFAGLPCGLCAAYYSFYPGPTPIASRASNDGHFQRNGLVRRMLDAIDLRQMVRSMSFQLIVLAPLITYSELQRLHLLPLRPLLPTLQALNPRSPFSPLRLDIPNKVFIASAASLLAFHGFKRMYLQSFLQYSTLQGEDWHDRTRSGSVLLMSRNNEFGRPITPFNAVSKTILSSLSRFHDYTRRILAWTVVQIPGSFRHRSNDEIAGASEIMAYPSKIIVNNFMSEMIAWPLRGIVLRNMTWAFLSAATSPDQRHHAAWFSTDVFSVFMGPFSGFTWSLLQQDARYWSKVGLCFGFRLAMELAMGCCEGGILLWTRKANWVQNSLI